MAAVEEADSALVVAVDEVDSALVADEVDSTLAVAVVEVDMALVGLAPVVVVDEAGLTLDDGVTRSKISSAHEVAAVVVDETLDETVDVAVAVADEAEVGLAAGMIGLRPFKGHGRLCALSSLHLGAAVQESCIALAPHIHPSTPLFHNNVLLSKTVYCWGTDRLDWSINDSSPFV